MGFTPNDRASDARIDDGEFDAESPEIGEHEYDQSRTGFNDDDAEGDVAHGILFSDGKRRPWSHLNRVNKGYGNKRRKQQLNRSNRLDDVKFVCQELGYNSDQISFAKKIVQNLDLRSLSIGVETCILACVAFAADAHNDLYGLETPESQRFHEFIDAWDCDLESIQTAHERIQDYWLNIDADDSEEQSRIEEIVDEIWIQVESGEISDVLSHVQENVDEDDHDVVFEDLRKRMTE